MTALAATVLDLRTALCAWREKKETVALVPTMGALHRGHLTLVQEAKKATKRVVTSIFVNPLQFGPNEDFTAYPRQMEEDRTLLGSAGCDLVFAPSAAEMYPDGFVTTVQPGPLAMTLEGVYRPGHFAGVATVVAKLLLQVMPDIALFGEKDYQQLLIIGRMVRDLNIPVHIAGVPIVRETDGLALSSRNAYLSADERQRAVTLPNTLKETAAAIKGGQAVEAALEAGKKKLAMAGFAVDYLELADPHTLVPVRTPGAPARLLAATKIGKARLLDNMAV